MHACVVRWKLWWKSGVERLWVVSLLWAPHEPVGVWFRCDWTECKAAGEHDCLLQLCRDFFQKFDTPQLLSTSMRSLPDSSCNVLY